jgi:hypothetical protein
MHDEATIFEPVVKCNFAWDSIVISYIVDLQILGRDSIRSCYPCCGFLQRDWLHFAR